jgi:hypothetical protein
MKKSEIVALLVAIAIGLVVAGLARPTMGEKGVSLSGGCPSCKSYPTFCVSVSTCGPRPITTCVSSGTAKYGSGAAAWNCTGTTLIEKCDLDDYDDCYNTYDCTTLLGIWCVKGAEQTDMDAWLFCS